MKRNNKRALYEKIMKNVSRLVKKTLNENNEDRSVFCTLNIEFSEDANGMIQAYIGNDIDGSGINLYANDSEELAEQIKQEIIEYIDYNIG